MKLSNILLNFIFYYFFKMINKYYSTALFNNKYNNYLSFNNLVKFNYNNFLISNNHQFLRKINYCLPSGRYNIIKKI